MAFSKKFGLRANVIEKDYVLGWVLAGIFNHGRIGPDWILRGEPVLRNAIMTPFGFLKILILL